MKEIKKSEINFDVKLDPMIREMVKNAEIVQELKQVNKIMFTEINKKEGCAAKMLGKDIAQKYGVDFFSPVGELISNLLNVIKHESN